MSAALPIDPTRVEIRCEDCARDLGRSAPTLVVARWYGPFKGRGARGLRPPHWGLLVVGQKRPTRAAKELPPDSAGRAADLGSRTVLYGPHPNGGDSGGRAVELACRRCKRRGWRRRRKLYALAEQARDTGTSDAYLSLS
jgi:hypothetical protein